MMTKQTFFTLGLIMFVFVGYTQETFKRTLMLMGSRFDITVVANSKSEGIHGLNKAIEEISRIEALISSWDETSQTSLINQNAGIKPVSVDEELFNLIKRSIQISKLTAGAFDISYASMDVIWKFDGSLKVLPTVKNIEKAISKVGFQNIILNEKDSSVFLVDKGMKIGFGGIGKGYAADRAKDLLKSMGIRGGIINASGDMSTWGKQPTGQDWSVGIKNPLNKNKVFIMLPIFNKAVVTSGNYEKFVMINGDRYSHIIDPRTGYPSKGIVSASIFTSSAELADALATSIFVMGIDVGLNFINQINDVECILVDDLGAIHYSKNIKIELNKL
tara:strand:- start:10495 stop:11490 length:996 start_codon:yes stop_codon:yes gene_type:complete